MKKVLFFGLGVLIILLLYSFAFSNKFCGGIAENINTCPIGYECVMAENHPDSSGNCRFSPVFTLIELRNKYFR